MDQLSETVEGLPEAIGGEAANELCAICHRRRGEHRGPDGHDCPDGDAYTTRSHFIGAREWGRAPKWAERAREALWERQRGRVPVYVRKGDGFRLRGYEAIGGQP